MCRIALLRCAVALSAALASLAHAESPGRYPLAQDLPAFEAPDSPSASAESDLTEASGDLALGDALALALLRNPELAIDSYEQRAREAAALQARVRPNPTLSLELEDFAGTGAFRGARQAQTTLLLGQLVELGGKRAARVTLARAEVDIAAWDYELRRIDVLSRTSDAFIELLAAQERLKLADDALALAREVERVAGLRRRAGMASPAEEIRAGVAADVAGVEREHTQHELATARQALAAMWAGEASFARALGDLAQLPKPPKRAELASRLEASPGVARWQAELARREAARSAGAQPALARPRAHGRPAASGRCGRRRRSSSAYRCRCRSSIAKPARSRNPSSASRSSRRRQRAERVRIATALNAAQLGADRLDRGGEAAARARAARHRARRRGDAARLRGRAASRRSKCSRRNARKSRRASNTCARSSKRITTRARSNASPASHWRFSREAVDSKVIGPVSSPGPVGVRSARLLGRRSRRRAR